MDVNHQEQDHLVTGLSLIVFTDEFGPTLINSTDPNLMVQDKVGFRFNLAHRLVLVCGIGDTVVELEKLHGPVEIPEMKPTQNVWVLPFLAHDSETIDARIKQKGRLTLFAVHSLASDKKELKKLEKVMQLSLRKSINLLRDTKTNNLTMDKLRSNDMVSKILSNFHQELDAILALRQERERIGKNLFNLGTLKNLPTDMQNLAKVIIHHPDGITISDIKKIGKFEDELLIPLVEKMERMGYLDIKFLENNKSISVKMDEKD